MSEAAKQQSWATAQDEEKHRFQSVKRTAEERDRDRRFRGVQEGLKYTSRNPRRSAHRLDHPWPRTEKQEGEEQVASDHGFGVAATQRPLSGEST